jgi:L-seryl-tRNA(Ser) seleniumtransferase
VLHTNMGRAPLAEEAAHAAFQAARSYLNLELDLATGKRSSRQDFVRELLIQLTGAESATAVNNCAAATVLVLRTLAAGREVIVSRGQLIEIGGSFRIPEIMAVSGAVLREVGTTNITRLADYERAVSPHTAALMRIHPSNYRIQGFTGSVSLPELVQLGRKAQLPVIDDVGSGALFELPGIGFPGEPKVRESIEQGADVVLCSGDKLLGGPQAGLIMGKKAIVERLERDPLMRPLRLDKMTLAALEATLRLYLNPETAVESVPILRMLRTPLSELHSRAERLARRLADLPHVIARVEMATSYFGGGSLPQQELPTWVVCFRSAQLSETQLTERLRLGDPAVVGCLRGGQVVLDPRTIFPEQEDELLHAIQKALDSKTLT